MRRESGALAASRMSDREGDAICAAVLRLVRSIANDRSPEREQVRPTYESDLLDQWLYEWKLEKGKR